jgi:putative nucleotidyltransferase with HDIG domain
VNILNGFRRVLRQKRNECDMYFADSGDRALEVMENQPIDIIITDINMPMMNGIQLLEKVADFYPGTIRIVLSGRSESDLIMKSVALTHQFLTKPCDPETLISIIRQADRSKNFLQNENLKNLIVQLGALPSIPILYQEVVKELENPDVSIKKVGEIISQDPGMAAKILQLANSAFFGRRREVSNISESVSYLGLDRITQLILVLGAFVELHPVDNDPFTLDEIWAHSNSIAMRAKKIAEDQLSSTKTIDDSFTAGLLHDIGKLILASRIPEMYSEAVNKSRTDGTPLWLAEQETYSTTHAEVGAYLLAIWGLPKSIVDAAAYHHNPSATDVQEFCPLTAVHAADTLYSLSNNTSVH